MLTKKREYVSKKNPSVNVSAAKFKGDDRYLSPLEKIFAALHDVKLMSFYIDFKQVNLINTILPAIVVKSNNSYRLSPRESPSVMSGHAFRQTRQT